MGRSIQQARKRRSGSQWKRLITEQSESGLSQRAFCDSRGLAYSSFCNWRRRLGAHSSEPDSGGGFIEVEVGPGHDEQWDVELTLGEGVVLRVRRR